MEIPLANLRAASSGAAELSVLDSAITAAKAVAEEIGPRFRINAATTVRDWQPADTDRIQEISHKLGLPKFDEGGLTKVLDAKGFGVVGYSQLLPGWTRDSTMVPGKIESIGVLPEFRNRSNTLIDTMLKDMSKSKEPWRANAFDDTFGKVIRGWERHGQIDVVSRHHGGTDSPVTFYSFRLNNDSEAEIARRSIVADTNVRPATKQDVDRIQLINDKYGLKWIKELVDHTTVAETAGHDVVGFAYFDPFRSEIKALGVLPQFQASAEPLIKDVAARMQSPEQPISLMGNRFTTGSVLSSLERSGTIQMQSKFDGGSHTFYEFTVPKSAGT